MSRRRRDRLTGDKWVGGPEEARAIIAAMNDAVEEPLDEEDSGGAAAAATDEGEEEVVGVATGEDYDPEWLPDDELPEGVEEE